MSKRVLQGFLSPQTLKTWCKQNLFFIKFRGKNSFLFFFKYRFQKCRKFKLFVFLGRSCPFAHLCSFFQNRVHFIIYVLPVPVSFASYTVCIFTPISWLLMLCTLWTLTRVHQIKIIGNCIMHRAFCEDFVPWLYFSHHLKKYNFLKKYFQCIQKTCMWIDLKKRHLKSCGRTIYWSVYSLLSIILFV